ncbi:MAG TPA: ATP-binding protein [Phycisphaerae bacterium]|nr:ATP-binding protein [Phycisphaerae bacterium]
MIRLRWHHLFIVFTICMAGIILLSLELHRESFQRAGKLLESAARLDEKPRWFKRIEQGILELSAPGNDVFTSHDVAFERRRLAQALARLDEELKSESARALDVGSLQTRIEAMAGAARTVFDNFEQLEAPGVSGEQQRTHLMKAAQAMSRMDREQLTAVREIGILADRTRAEQRNILDEHEENFQAGMVRERYFIAAGVVFLFGLLWIGYRLQKTSEALETERRRVQEERRERLAATGELCSSVAHGIRNPLAAIQSSAELTLEMGRLDEESRRRLEDILSEGQRLADRVTGLLGIARVHAEGFQLLNLQDVVSTAVHGIEPEIKRQGLLLQRSLPKVAISVRGDRLQLEQLVIELVSNAMEHSPPGQPIEVRCDRPVHNGTAEITVQDAGEGVPVSARGRLFDLFFTTKPHGTGIGLATVRRIARLHGGDVVLADSPRGAKFVVSLPTTDGDLSAA